MTRFGFITEGRTDQKVLENILCGYFKSYDLSFKPFLPLYDETDKNNIENFSNWKLVLDYCASEKFKEAFQFIDYLIVQIDTDTCEEPHYDIENGMRLKPDELVEKVSEKLQGLIGQEFYEDYSQQIIFAISVHETECWLLPLYYADKKKEKHQGCLSALNRALTKKNMKGISANNKIPDYYEEISKQYLKNKVLKAKYKHNSSFKIFIEELDKREIDIEE